MKPKYPNPKRKRLSKEDKLYIELSGKFNANDYDYETVKRFIINISSQHELRRGTTLGFVKHPMFIHEGGYYLALETKTLYNFGTIMMDIKKLRRGMNVVYTNCGWIPE